LTVLVDTVRKKITPIDDALPAREMKETYYEEVDDIPPPIPERIALLRVAPVNQLVDDIGMNRGDGVYIVCEL